MEKYLKDFDVQNKNPSERALRRWRSAVNIVKNPRRRYRMVADLKKRSEAEKEEPKTQTSQQDGELTVESLEAEDSSRADIAEDNNIGDYGLQGRRDSDWSSWKADLEKIFVIINFVLELPSAVFDQLSSVHKPQYALLSMLLSFVAILICIAELLYKIRKDKVTWKWTSTLPWLYYPSETHKPIGNFKDIVGLVCAICQSIVTTITFVLVYRHVDNPIKISVWPIIFAFGLLCSKFLEK